MNANYMSTSLYLIENKNKNNLHPIVNIMSPENTNKDLKDKEKGSEFPYRFSNIIKR